MKKVSTLRVFLVIDAIIILLLYFNADKYCDVPLNMWLGVGLLLSLPSSLGVHHVRKHFGYKSSLITEIVLLTASFLWMAVGTINISMSTTCQSTNPYVWWTVFVFVTFFWCTVVGFIICSILLTIIHQIMHGGRSPEF